MDEELYTFYGVEVRDKYLTRWFRHLTTNYLAEAQTSFDEWKRRGIEVRLVQYTPTLLAQHTPEQESEK